VPEQARQGDPVRAAAPAGPQLNDWNLLRSFIAVYEAGTLTEAARRLATTQPSVGRHVRELERGLGEALFVRQPGRLKPTERAHALYGAVLAM
jgi:DNA-binding transcriptional LysR family regulator